MNDIQRRKLLQLLVLGGLASPVNAFWFSSKDNKQAVKRQIHALKGTATINGLEATTASSISPGDEIRTGDNTRIVFHQGKDAYLLRSNTYMKLEGNDSFVNTLRIISGAVLSVFGSGNKRIITPVATAGIRGTGTYFEVNDSETYLCTCYGQTTLTSNDDPTVTESMSTTYHESPRIIKKTTQGSHMEKAPVINHTDAELIMLEATVGRKPPFATDYDPDADFDY